MDQIHNLVMGHTEKHKDVVGAAKDRNVVILIGGTGSGKSTIANLLSEHALLRTQVDGQSRIDRQDQTTGFPIGHDGTSVTTLPQFQEVEGMLIYDVAGNSDTRGSAFAVLNAAMIKSIAELAATVRFLFVSSRAEVDARRGSALRELVESAQKLVPGINIAESSAVVVTMTPSGSSTADEVSRIKRMVGDDVVVNHWVECESVVPFPEPENDNINFGVRTEILRILKALPGQPIDELVVGAILDATEREEIGGFLNLHVSKLLQTHSQSAENRKDDLQYFETGFMQTWEALTDQDPILLVMSPIAGELVTQAKQDGSSKAKAHADRVSAKIRAERLQREAEEQRQQALAQRQAAEAAEAARQQAERQRQEEASRRQAAEAARQQAERQRQAAEAAKRKADEARRIAEEKARMADPRYWPVGVERRTHEVDVRYANERQSGDRSAVKRIGSRWSRRDAYGWWMIADFYGRIVTEEKKWRQDPKNPANRVQEQDWTEVSRSAEQSLGVRRTGNAVW